MKIDRITPLYMQVQKLADKQKLTPEQMAEWIVIVKTAYVRGEDDIVKAINGNN